MLFINHVFARCFVLLLAMVSLAFGQPALDSFNPIANDEVRAILVQPDGKIVIGGDFLTVNGTLQSHVARLNADGSVDATFLGNWPKSVHALALQDDGKILVGGNFPLLRLNTNGTRDMSFTATNSGSVLKIQVQPDHHVLALYQGTKGLIRHIPTGGQDASFVDSLGWSSSDFGLLADGKIIIVGAGVTPTNAIRRLNSDGSRDATFTVSAALPTNILEQTHVSGLALQPDGRILVGGAFSTLNGQSRPDFGRLNPDGSLDGTYLLGSNALGTVDVLLRRPSGRIIAAHQTGQLRCYRSGGVLDTNFNFAVTNVKALALQPDGAILLGGNFTTVNGTNRTRLARLLPNDPVVPPPSGPPQILEFMEQPGGHFHFNATNLGPAGTPFQVLAATNILQPSWNWVSLGQPAPGSQGYQYGFIDSLVVSNAPKRFYQLRIDP